MRLHAISPKIAKEPRSGASLSRDSVMALSVAPKRQKRQGAAAVRAGCARGPSRLTPVRDRDEQVPEYDRPVVGAGRQGLAVGADGDGPDASLVRGGRDQFRRPGG